MAKDKLEGIVPKGTEVKRLCTGFHFAEGPVWDRREGCLLFSDIQFKNELPGNRIMRWSPSGGLEVFREPSGNSNALTFDEEGKLIVCEMGNRCISSIGSDGVRRVLVDRFNGRRFNAPNDLVVRYDGTIYFSDLEYGIYIGDREIPQQGLYRFHPSDGRLEMLAEDFVQPNGLAFSPNNHQLYVIDSAHALYHVRVFDVDETVGITGGHVIAKVPRSDGMKTDRNGNLYVAGSEGVYVLSPSGEHLGIIPVPKRPSNLAWGDNDWRTLYIAARSALYQIRLISQGVPTF